MFDFLKSRYQKIKHIFSSQKLPEELEQILYEADLGSAVIQDLMQSSDVAALKKRALAILEEPPSVEQTPPHHPHVILIVGINGSGKTTTVAKLAAHYQREKKKVLLAAGDTFRAAATEQLEIWAKKLQIDFVKGIPGADPSSVIFDALQSGKAKNIDIVIADTAGRLDSKADLMKELDKIYRVIKKCDPTAPHEVLLVLDGSLGQNTREQAATFHKYAPITGFVITKLDGSSKGGIILRLYREMGIPTQWIGVGEGIDDLLPFDPHRYVEALFS